MTAPADPAPITMKSYWLYKFFWSTGLRSGSTEAQWQQAMAAINQGKNQAPVATMAGGDTPESVTDAKGKVIVIPTQKDSHSEKKKKSIKITKTKKLVKVYLHSCSAMQMSLQFDEIFTKNFKILILQNNLSKSQKTKKVVKVCLHYPFNLTKIFTKK